MKKKICFYIILFCISINKLLAQGIGEINMSDSISFFDYGEMDKPCIDAWFDTYCLNNETGYNTIQLGYGINVPNIGVSDKLDVCHPRYHIATRTYLPKYDGIWRITIRDSSGTYNNVNFHKTFQTTANHSNLGDGSYYRDEDCLNYFMASFKNVKTLIFEIYAGYFDYDETGKPKGILKPATGDKWNPKPDVIRKLDIFWVEGKDCRCNIIKMKRKHSEDINIIGSENKDLVNVQLNNKTLNLNSPKGVKIYSVSIFDMFGMMIKSKSFSGQGNYSIDLNDLKNNMYIIQSYTESGFSASKIYLK